MPIYKKSFIALIMVIVSVALFPLTIAAEPLTKTSLPVTEQIMRIGLWTNQPNVLISGNVDFEVVNGDTGEVVQVYPAQQKVSFSTQVGAITINGKPIAARNVEVLLRAQGDEQYIEVNKRRYRGVIKIHRTTGKAGLTVVNVLPIEQYLYGIIAREISPEWPMEAVKAQAVAARTYALYNLNKHGEDGFDLCSSTDCQVYGGRESENPRATHAVDETRGQVVVYKGKLIATYFYSSAGGYTENSENVWGSAQPYLQAVPDFDQQSPHFKWQKEISSLELENIFDRAGYHIGSLQAIELSRLTAPPVQAVDRGVSGRVKMARIIGTTGSVELTGAKLRSLLSLNSTLFDVSIIVPVQKSFDVKITDSYGDRETKQVDINVPPREEKVLVTDKPNIRRFSGRSTDTVLISGYGWGHGVGLSQWGAKAMAEKAPQGDTAYFKQILKHYYRGVDIQKIY